MGDGTVRGEVAALGLGEEGCNGGGWPLVSRWQQALAGAGISGLAGVAWSRPIGVGCAKEVEAGHGGWVVRLAGDCGGATDGCRVGGCSHG